MKKKAPLQLEPWEKDELTEAAWQEALKLVRAWEQVEAIKARLRKRLKADDLSASDRKAVHLAIKAKVEAEQAWSEKKTKAEMRALLRRLLNE